MPCGFFSYIIRTVSDIIIIFMPLLFLSKIFFIKIGRTNMGDIIPSPEDLECCENNNELTRAAPESSLCLQNSTASSEDHFMEWTDEKHSSYLDSLEASFVEQLHQSMDLLWQHASDKLPANVCNSDQYKVLQHGSCKKLNLKNSISFPDSEVNSHNLLGNAWIRHFKPAGWARAAFTRVLREQVVLNRDAGPLSSKRYMKACSKRDSMSQDCYQSSVGSTAEFSDQNFEDEDKEEKPIDLPMSKRLKTDVLTNSSNDQVTAEPILGFLMSFSFSFHDSKFHLCAISGCALFCLGSPRGVNISLNSYFCWMKRNAHPMDGEWKTEVKNRTWDKAFWNS